jgi:hypothetical protein
VEANFVGNTGIWETATNSAAGSGSANGLLGGLNTPNPAVFARYGIDPTTVAGQATLSATLGSAAGKASGVPLPYPSFPLTATVLQALRPYPHVNGSITIYGAPVGDSWYDSLQAKVTKRFSHGFTLTSAFTWSKTEANPAGTFNATSASINNIFNRPIQKGITVNDLPFLFNTGFSYELQKYAILGSIKFLRAAVAGWNVGGLFLYASGTPIAAPTSSNNMSGWYGQNTPEDRVAGQPLFLENPNCHCINPTTQFVLNPAAWVNPPAGLWGTSSPYWNDYRYARRPSESMNIGRTFRVREKMSLEIRAEFFNIFNRVELNNPTNTSPQGARTCNNGPILASTNTCSGGGTSPSGFGAISYSSLYAQPRNGQLVARFTF